MVLVFAMRRVKGIPALSKEGVEKAWGGGNQETQQIDP